MSGGTQELIGENAEVPLSKSQLKKRLCKEAAVKKRIEQKERKKEIKKQLRVLKKQKRKDSEQKRKEPALNEAEQPGSNRISRAEQKRIGEQRNTFSGGGVAKHPSG